MSDNVSYDCASGPWHIAIRLKGRPDNIERFHKIMYRCEGDWPWMTTRRTSVSVCDTCMGVICVAPRVSPADLKAAARQAGCTVKIDKFAPEDHCFTETKRWCQTTYLPHEEATKLTKYKTKFLVITGDRKVMHVDDMKKLTDPYTDRPIQPGTARVPLVN